MTGNLIENFLSTLYVLIEVWDFNMEVLARRIIVPSQII